MGHAVPLDPKLKDYATPRQAEFIDAVIQHGTQRAAAAALGVAQNAVSQGINSARLNAARRGYAPGHFSEGVAPGYAMGKVTVQRGPGGTVERTWERQSPEGQAQEAALREFVRHLAEDIRGLAPITPPPEYTDADLLCVYPMGDPHFGMYAWAEEAGENFDLAEAERLTCAAVDRLVSSAPAAETALILELGDFFHADTVDNRTRSGHALDVDGRYAKVMQVGLRAMVHCIRRAMEKHRRVVVRIVKGNHDGHASFALALALDAFFHLEPRVEIDMSAAAVWAFQFGKVMIASTHGDTTKMNALAGVMACDWPEMWGSTKFRYGYLGHVHHDDAKEYPGVKCETFRTLAARDAWHAGQGYRAGRDMRLIVQHREFGEIERHRVDVAMLNAA